MCWNSIYIYSQWFKGSESLQFGGSLVHGYKNTQIYKHVYFHNIIKIYNNVAWCYPHKGLKYPEQPKLFHHVSLYDSTRLVKY